MNDLHKRLLLFLFGCMSVRVALVFLARRANENVLKVMGYIALLPAIGFLYLFFSGKRKTGGETFGANIWWNNLRPIHGILYLLFAWYAIHGDRRAWILLMIDVIFGLISFLTFHSFIRQ